MTHIPWLRSLALGLLLAAPAVSCSDQPVRYCFVAGTMVLAVGGARPIEELSIGDLVWSWDLEAMKPATARVTHVLRARADRLLCLRSSAGTIRGVTAGHRFYDPERRAWRPAGRLGAGDVLLHWTGAGAARPAVIEAVSAERPDREVEVFNITVEGTHCYFAQDVLVHNKQPPPYQPPPDRDEDGYPSSAERGSQVQALDCADDDPAIHPGASERCDGADQSCDGQIDEGCLFATGALMLRLESGASAQSPRPYRLEPAGVELGALDDAAVMTPVDLQGPARVIDERWTALPPDAAHPAVIIAAATGDQRTAVRLVVVSLRPDAPKVVLDAPLRFEAGGYAHEPEAIQLEQDEPGRPLAIRLTLRRTPLEDTRTPARYQDSPGEAPLLLAPDPGAVERRFVWTGEGYRAAALPGGDEL